MGYLQLLATHETIFLKLFFGIQSNFQETKFLHIIKNNQYSIVILFINTQ